MKMRGYQYADDTTLYCHAKSKVIKLLTRTANKSIEHLGTWAKNNNLVLNKEKIKFVILSTQKMSKRHGFKDVFVSKEKRLKEQRPVSCLG